MSDSLTVFGTDYTGVTGIKATGTGNGTLTYIRPSGTKNIGANGTGIDVTAYASVNVAVPDSTFVVTISYNSTTEMWEPDCTVYELQDAYAAGKDIAFVGPSAQPVSWICDDDYEFVYFIFIENPPTLRCYVFTRQGVAHVWDEQYIVPLFDSPSRTYTPTTQQQTDTITYDPIDYTGIQQVNITVDAMPTGSVSASASKGTVSNHSVSVTPTATVGTAGYLAAGNTTGTAVTVSASELVSGTYTVDSSGTKDVTNYATATVPMADFGPSVGGSFIYSSGGNLVWRESGGGYAESAGWVNEGGVEDYLDYNAIPQNITITPTTSAQIIGGARYMMQGPVTVAAMPSGTAGTPSATKGSVSNHAVSVTPSVTNTTGYITGGTKTGTAVTVSASELVSGSQTITTNDTYDVTNLASVVVNVQGGGSSGMQVATTTATPSTASSSISFTVSEQPTSFYVTSAADLATGAAPYKVAAVTYDGTDLHGQIVTNTTNAQASYSTAFTQSYSSGTLTISSTGANFQAVQYKLVYTYGGTSANVGTADTQVGSGATSVTFTGLTDEPTCFDVIFKSNFSTSSGYQRVIAVTHDGNSTYGLAMDSAANAQSSWSYTYSNGSLTVTSQGTNNGGYFHQPGYYQLTYGIGGEVEPTEIDVQPLSVTQNGTYTAPDGVAYSPVTVAVSGGGGVSVGKTTWSNTSTSTVSHQFTGLSGTPKAAFLRCTAQLTRSSSNTYYYIADIVWDGTDAFGNYHLRSNGSFNNVASDAQSGFNVSVSGTSITFSSDATSRSSAPGSFYNGTYELTYIY